MGRMKTYLEMVAKSQLVAPNLKEMTLRFFTGNGHKGNHTARWAAAAARQQRRDAATTLGDSFFALPDRACRSVLRNHLLALRWMNPNAIVYMREFRGQGTPEVAYELCE
jgi:hypothetical protein